MFFIINKISNFNKSILIYIIKYIIINMNTVGNVIKNVSIIWEGH